MIDFYFNFPLNSSVNMVNKFLPQLSVTRGLGGFVISFFVAVFRVLVDENRNTSLWTGPHHQAQSDSFEYLPVATRCFELGVGHTERVFDNQNTTL